jgi:hypothetical protein
MFGKHRVLLLVVSIISLSGMALGFPIVTGYSGAPGTSGTCAISCHGSSGGTVTVSGFPSYYSPGQAYTVTIRHSSGTSIANFNCSIRIGTGSSNAGTITAGLNTATYNVSGETNGVHFSARDRDSGNFTWTAPDTGTGTCRLYLGGLQGSSDGQNSTIVQVTYEMVHDVGATRILAPTGTIDSSATVTPACSVYNYGNQAESYRVRMRIGSFYNDTAYVTSHAPGARVYVTFPSLSEWPRGTHAVACSTELANDATRANDKVTDSVAVRVRDVGCFAILAPSGIVDSGMVITPECSVANYGTVSETCRVTMKIGGFYTDSAVVTSQAGDRSRVTFRNWPVTEVGGPYTVSCSTALAGDMKSSDDKTADSLTVRRPPSHDVGCTQVVAPTGTIDSTADVTPACSLYNYGTTAETYRVRLKVGSFYDDTAQVTGHASGTMVYVTFPSLSTWPRGTFAVTCSTELASDTAAFNDKASGSVAVRVRDVACLSLTVPPDTVDSGTTVAPACSVYNYGTAPETYLVRMRIGSFYSDSATVTTHPAGAALQVGFRDWIVSEVGGPYAVVCSTSLTTDMVHANDEQNDSVMVTQPVRDVAVLQIIAPVDTVDTAAIVVPAALVRNLGEVQETFAVRYQIGSFYSADTVMTLSAGATDTVRFRDWTAGQVGTHAVRCSTMLAGDQNTGNDYAQDSVTVIGAGIDASAKVPARFALAGGLPSPFGRGTVIRFAIPRRTHVALNIYSAGGALVKVLCNSSFVPARYSVAWDGRDWRGRPVAPGVYYCRMRAAEYMATRKLIKTE